MKLAGHMAGGYLVSHVLSHRLTSDQKERRRLQILGALAGVLPDLDFLWHVYKKGKVEYKNDFRHHTWITHTFPFFWIPAAVLYTIGALKKKPKLQHAASVFAAGTTAHLLQDTIGSGDGIMLFYPFSKRMDGIGLLGLHGDEWEAKYTRSPIYLIELTISLIAGVVFVSDLFKKKI